MSLMRYSSAGTDVNIYKIKMFQPLPKTIKRKVRWLQIVR